ncbi:short-chain dehydrogenase [Maricaulis sp. W15]|uniref:Short-chain dehydrogenase/reductase SDR n=1 Tax=Maricaulis maris TaxID=74318 RepID=A0A495DJX2_9PROT|nr:MULTISPECIES: SDR family oxidoreductase [Maricaulis]OLF72985.1 short-chain dehydrogenase [Maricaulis sp. W15]RKR02923.1 hypothetical protein C7435_0867 [Maricaulis maris]
MRLKQKTAIITGASSGIGAAAAELFASEGARLVLGARRAVELDAVAGRIREAGGEAECVVGDVVDPEFHAAMVNRASDRFGGLDIAFNNAGTLGEMGPAHEVSAAGWRETLAVNLDSAHLAACAQVPAMLARGGGSITFTGSFVGHTIGIPGMGAYAASKAGLIGLVQTLAVELGQAGVRVNALLPGGTKTAMAGDDPDYHAQIASFHALKRMAEPIEIARAALFLASEESSFVTGTAFLADGGNSILKA